MVNEYVVSYYKDTDDDVKTLKVYGKNAFWALSQAVNLISAVGYTENDIVKIEKTEC